MADKNQSKETKKNQKKEKPQSECACGCGQLTSGNFVQGHDAKAASWLRYIAHDADPFEIVDGEKVKLSTARITKLQKMVDTHDAYKSEYFQNAIKGEPKPASLVKAGEVEARKAERAEAKAKRDAEKEAEKAAKTAKKKADKDAKAKAEANEKAAKRTAA